MTGAPPWTWYLAALYLADIHNHTWNKEQGFIPITARDGITRDLSRLLQFIFWERILYLDHKALFRIRKNVKAILLVVPAMLVIN